MSSKRIFIGVDISSEARDICSSHIADLRQEFPNVRVGWERPEKLHITLKFLGDVEESGIGNISASVAHVASRHSSFTLGNPHTGVFPSNQRPRIVWIGLADKSETIFRIQADLESVCSELGFERESRSFQPHVTIGRIREPHSVRILAEKHLSTHLSPIEFKVGEIVVYESKLQPTGSVYSKLSTASLR